MVLEKPFTGREVLHADSSFAGFDLHEAVDQEERIAMRQNFLDLPILDHNSNPTSRTETLRTKSASVAVSPATRVLPLNFSREPSWAFICA